MLSFIKNFFWAPRQTENLPQSQTEPEESRKRKGSSANLPAYVKKPRALESTHQLNWNLDLEQADYKFSQETISIFKGSGATVLVSRQVTQGLAPVSVTAPLLLHQSTFAQPTAAAIDPFSNTEVHSHFQHSFSAGCWQRRTALGSSAIPVLRRVENLPTYCRTLVSPVQISQFPPRPPRPSSEVLASTAAPPAAAPPPTTTTITSALIPGLLPCVHSTPLVRAAMSGQAGRLAGASGASVAAATGASAGPTKPSDGRQVAAPAPVAAAACASSAKPQSGLKGDANDDDDCVITSVEGPKSVAEMMSPCSKYLASDWLADIKTSSQSLKSYMQRVESEETLKMQYWAKRRESDERDLVARVTRNLKLAERELPVLPYKYEEPPPTPPPSPPEPEPAEPEFPELSEAQLRAVERAWSRQLPGSEVLAEGFSLRVTREELRSLCGLNWLNDNVVNFYMQLIAAREGPGLPKVHAFSTFFYTKFSSSGYASVRRWTKKVDIFDRDVLLCPVHLHNNHWTLCIIDMRSRHIIHLDSLSRGGGGDPSCLALLRRYLAEEHKDKKGTDLDVSEFQLVREVGAPQQENGSDCGVFCCKFADYYCKGREFTFGQPHMPYYRKRTTVEILEKRLLW